MCKDPGRPGVLKRPFPLWLEAVEAFITGIAIVSALATMVLVAVTIYFTVRALSDGWRWSFPLIAFAACAATGIACRTSWAGLRKLETAEEAFETPAGWDEYRRRLRCFQVVMAAGLVFIVAALIPPLAPVEIVFVFPFWILAFVGSGLRLHLFECPRCHRPFFLTWGYRIPFLRRCVHCGLSKWEESDQHENCHVDDEVLSLS